MLTISKIPEFISYDLASPPSIQEVAKMCYMCATKFKEDFKRRYGCGMGEYHQNLRMEKGWDLIISGSSVIDAGRMVGYSNLSHFAKVFKRKFGVHPSSIKGPLTKLDKNIPWTKIEAVLNEDEYVGLTALVKLAKVSRSTLIKKFSLKYGLSVKKYHIKKKFERVLTEIKRGDIKVKDLGYGYGYTNTSNFISQFKAIYGTTPKKINYG